MSDTYEREQPLDVILAASDREDPTQSKLDYFVQNIINSDTYEDINRFLRLSNTIYTDTRHSLVSSIIKAATNANRLDILEVLFQDDEIQSRATNHDTLIATALEADNFELLRTFFKDTNLDLRFQLRSASSSLSRQLYHTNLTKLKFMLEELGIEFIGQQRSATEMWSTWAFRAAANSTDTDAAESAEILKYLWKKDPTLDALSKDAYVFLHSISTNRIDAVNVMLECCENHTFNHSLKSKIFDAIIRSDTPRKFLEIFSSILKDFQPDVKRACVAAAMYSKIEMLEVLYEDRPYTRVTPRMNAEAILATTHADAINYLTKAQILTKSEKFMHVLYKELEKTSAVSERFKRELRRNLVHGDLNKLVQHDLHNSLLPSQIEDILGINADGTTSILAKKQPRV